MQGYLAAGGGIVRDCAACGKGETWVVGHFGQGSIEVEKKRGHWYGFMEIEKVVWINVSTINEFAIGSIANAILFPINRAGLVKKRRSHSKSRASSKMISCSRTATPHTTATVPSTRPPGCCVT